MQAAHAGTHAVGSVSHGVGHVATVALTAAHILKSNDELRTGVHTPGCMTLQRRAGRDHEWIALCVSEKDGTSMDVVRAGGNGGRRLGRIGAGHHYIKCFVAVRAIRSFRSPPLRAWLLRIISPACALLRC